MEDYKKNENNSNWAQQNIYGFLIPIILGESLLPKIELIQTEVICYNPAVLITSEARTVAEIEDCEVVIQDYQLVRCDSSSRHTGGIVIYIRNGIEYKVKKKIISDPNYWFSFIEVKVSGQKWSIGGVYHSPSASDADFIDKLEDVLDDYFSNTADKCNKIIELRNIKEEIFSKINIDLLFCKWVLNSINVNDIYENLLVNVTEVVNANAPKHTLSIKSNQVPYFDIQLKDKAKERDLAYKQFSKSSDYSDRQNKWHIYKKIRNEYVNLLKVIKNFTSKKK
nr:unnamed protein product [Callosobruchus analis]